MAKQTEQDFKAIFTKLVNIMQKDIDESIQIRAGKPHRYEFYGPPSPRMQGKELWFGAVRIGKSYVSYHLMAVYVFPDLVMKMSPELKKRMHGKSCFNFTRINDQLFLELDELTKVGYERFKQAGFLG